MSNLEDPEDHEMVILYIIATVITTAIIFVAIVLIGGGKIDWSLELNNMIPMGIAILTFGVLYGVLYADRMRRSAKKRGTMLRE